MGEAMIFRDVRGDFSRKGEVECAVARITRNSQIAYKNRNSFPLSFTYMFLDETELHPGRYIKSINFH